MDIRVNGESKTIEPGMNIFELLLDLQIQPASPGIAVALNREVVPRKLWQDTEIHSDSEVEIIRAVQGG